MKQLLEYKCPCCDGAIGFDSDVQKMKCPYCDTEFDVATLEAYNAIPEQTQDDLQWKTASEDTWLLEEEGLVGYICQSCGGQIVGDEHTAASSCPFCGNPVVMAQNVSGQLKPDLVIPFKLDKEDAKAALRRHYKGKTLLPNAFRDENRINEIKGVYVPFWLFDADANADVRYRATKLRFWSDANYNYTKTSYFSVRRAGSLEFRKVPVDGSTKMADELMESIEPYDLSEAVDFKTAYLAGYLADKYDVSAEESIPRANERIKRSTEEMFASTVVGYSSVTPQSSSVKVEKGEAKYALLPVWLLNTSWKGQTYTFAMNGQTGRMVGDLPMDKGKYRKWLWGLTAIIGAVCFAGAAVFWML